MIEYILAIIIGVLSSAVACLIFLLFLSRIRPKIIISDQIAKEKSIKGSIAYRIRVINKTHRPIMDIKAQLHRVTLIVVPGGTIPKVKEIPLKRSEIMELPKFDPRDKEANYAYRFVTYENVEEIWGDDTKSYLRFRIYAKDSLSGFGKVFIKNYHTKRNSIKEGSFKVGNSLEIR